VYRTEADSGKIAALAHDQTVACFIIPFFIKVIQKENGMLADS
jgi:hypothetical protein